MVLQVNTYRIRVNLDFISSNTNMCFAIHIRNLDVSKCVFKTIPSSLFLLKGIFR